MKIGKGEDILFMSGATDQLSPLGCLVKSVTSGASLGLLAQNASFCSSASSSSSYSSEDEE
jgi:hypothetical protein